MLSDAGELLNVVTCSAGNISVFRAHSAADLRPYQRALAGVPTKERFVIALDGGEFAPSEAIMIGFGEGPIKSELTTRDYLLEVGASEEAVDALLLSVGLERYSDTPCSSLPADEERRTRLVAATLQPQRAIIINEPFEPISSQWRERAADLLSSCARSQNALIVIPSLSYRPDGWIDNPAVARIQVGQTLQKTIGFGAAGSTANDFMEELKSKVRADYNNESTQTPPAAAAAAVCLASPPSQPLDTARQPSTIAKTLSTLMLSSKAKLSVGALAATCVTLTVALSLFTTPSQDAQQTAPSVTSSELPPSPPIPQAKEAPVSLPHPQDAANYQPASLTQQAPPAPALDAAPIKPAGAFVLDSYPPSVKDALLATVRGMPSEVAVTDTALDGEAPTAPAGQRNGNLFKLLEQAGSSTAQGAGDAPAPSDDYQTDSQASSGWSAEEQTYENPEEAESRREAIREKFLEAIRAAAERRENEMQE